MRVCRRFRCFELTGNDHCERHEAEIAGTVRKIAFAGRWRRS